MTGSETGGRLLQAGVFGEVVMISVNKKEGILPPWVN